MSEPTSASPAPQPNANNSTSDTTPELPPDAERALGVLAEAVVSNDPGSAFVRFARGRDVEDVVTAVLLWIDALAATTGHPPVPDDEEAFFGFAITDPSGETVGVDDVEPELAWAARVITARLNRDRAQFNALFCTLGNDTELLNGCATILELITGAVQSTAMAQVRARLAEEDRP